MLQIPKSQLKVPAMPENFQEVQQGHEDRISKLENSVFKDKQKPVARSVICGQEWTPKSPKRILVLYSTDSPQHATSVHWLRDFLIKHCCCAPVILLSEQDESMTFHEWFENERRHADKIVVIFSEGAHKWPVTNKQSPDNPTDKFLTALNVCLSDDFERDRSKYVIAYFEYSQLSDVISPMKGGATYELMKDIDKMILRIHNFCPSGPLNQKQHSNVSIHGQNLSLNLAEMQDSMQFDREFENLTMGLESFFYQK